MTHNVTVFGHGVHAQRYVDALLFYPGVDRVEQIQLGHSLSPLSDIAVLAEPYTIDRKTIDLLTAHLSLKWIICEKFPYKDSNSTRNIIDLLCSKRLYFVHTRCYEPLIQFPDTPVIRIEWPNVYRTGMDPLWNTLPNILDWLLRQTGELPQSEEVNLFQKDGVWKFSVCLRNVRYEISIVPADEQAKVLINGVPQQWPNYIQTYHNVLDQILTEKVQQDKNHQHTLATLDLINDMIYGKDH